MKKFIKLLEELSYYDDDDIEVITVNDVIYAFNEIKNKLDDEFHKEQNKEDLIKSLKNILK